MNRHLLAFLTTPIILTCGTACRSTTRSAVAPGGTEFVTGMNMAVQGDLRSARPHLLKASQEGLQARDWAVAQCVAARFDPKAPEEAPADLDEWTAKVLRAYRHYWSGAMLAKTTAAAAEIELAKALAPLAGVDAPAGAPADMDALEPKLQAKLEARGYHALFGVTTPFREFMLWRTQTDHTYTVELPGGPQAVRVVMLDGFISLGWVGFATCDRAHAGGWTKPDGLYCVRSSYDTESESFRVSYLAHEGQHFADNREFPDLEQPELEYRAKLVEIAGADATLSELLASFDANLSDSREQPHAFANKRLMTDLARVLQDARSTQRPWWKPVAPAAIRAAAARLLEEDTERLRAQPGGPRLQRQ